MVGTSTYTTSGTYTDILVNARGCDSIVTTNLTVTVPLQSSQTRNICQGNSFSIGTHTYTLSGVYHDTLSNSQGCDSIVHTTLNVSPALQGSQNRQICPGQVVTVATHTYSTIGIFQDTLLTAQGCDSILTTTITNSPAIQFSQSLQICSGGGVQVGNSFYTTQGTFTDSLIASTGCDSIVTSHIAVVLTILVNQNLGICPGDSIAVDSNFYSQAGFYEDTLLASGGCDSIVSTNLVIHPVFLVQDTQAICQGSSYNFGGNLLMVAGVYVDTLSSFAGCDSIVELTLNVNQNPMVNLVNTDTLICANFTLNPIILAGSPPGGSFSGTGVSGNVFDPVGLAQDVYMIRYLFTNSNGCSASDSFAVTLTTCAGISTGRFNAAKIFPNPAREYFTVSGIQTGTDIEVFDIHGKSVFHSISGARLEHIRLMESPGIYFVKISREGEETVKRLLLIGE